MPAPVDDLLERIGALERELEGELNRSRADWRYRIERGRVRFEQGAREAQRRFRQGVLRFLRESYIPSVLTAPVIYSLVVPVALLDLWVTIFQAICFRAYGIALVERSRFVVIDRQYLSYLNAIEKLNCVYCGYTNGVFGYVREVAARTEQYWCPIRHARRVRAAHAHYREFVAYGDAEGYRKQLPLLRRELEAEREPRDR
jgi:hypothetical protein